MSILKDQGEVAEDLPRDSYDLIGYLDKAYPHRCISPGESLEMAHRYAGIRQLIDELMEWKREEEDKLSSTEAKVIKKRKSA